MSFAVRLNQLRVKKGKSLQDVAEAIGVSKTHVWELEKGRSENPSLDMLSKLAEYFNVTIKFLVGEDYESEQDEQLSKMFKQIGDLTDSDRAILNDMILSMKKRRNTIDN